MGPRNTTRDWVRLLYYLSQNAISLIGVVLTTSSAVTIIASWIYDFMLPGPAHPYVGILLFLILPALFILGLVLIPIGILLHDPNNLGHNDSSGCFRCHDGSHISADGQAISNDCTACHNLLAVQEENPKILVDLGLQ